MLRSIAQLRADALRIWHASLAAVRSDRLMQESVRLEGHTLVVGGSSENAQRIELTAVQRIAVVGAGKAGAGMAVALEQTLGSALMEQKQLVGWVNVPAGTETATTQRIYLHAARPAGVNEPTAEGVFGSERMLEIVGALEQDDLCIALLSGGGSALTPAPIEGISLADKLAVTRFLSAAGANITELNTVRKQLSRIKGGGLARACKAGRLIALIISDVPGDPLDVIASGPTVVDNSTPNDAMQILERFGARDAGIPEDVFRVPSRKAEVSANREEFRTQVANFVIGNNAMAVDAAGMEAERLGYAHAMNCATQPEGAVEAIGRHLADMAALMQRSAGPNCLISGGEGTVKLMAEAERGLGGRNQQTVLAALLRLAEIDSQSGSNLSASTAILSGGTDGEDGPTDAAGALVDQTVIAEAKRRSLDAADFLRRNDAYRFFDSLDALIKTGPTNTNVCDVRVVLVSRN
jgi:glycerate 2-kinase